MTNATNQKDTAARYWRMSTIGGVVVAVLLVVASDVGLIPAAVVGVVVAVLAGTVLNRMKPAGDAASQPDAPAAMAADTVAQPDAAPEFATEPAPVSAPEASAPTASSASSGSIVKPSTPLPGQQELAERKGTWRYEGAAAKG